ncbi:MAG: VWA domain-containing protein [Planctomycetota bacterium]
MVVELIALGTFAVILVAEFLHQRRCARLAPLAFGPLEKPSLFAKLAPAFRVIAIAALAWGLVSLLVVRPKAYRPEGEVRPGKEQHLMIVLDVSPSMRLEDAGPSGKQSRKDRGRDIMRSLFQRLTIDRYLVSCIAVYNGAKPVVVDSKDLNVIDGVLGDLPLYQAFESGQTRLLDGLREAVKIAKPWNPRSTTVILISDGDTVPPQGMPAMPASVGSVMVVGVGDLSQGSFIDGRQSKQDAFMLRQIATRLNGTYHNGNKLHLPSDLIAGISQRGVQNQSEPWTRREYALLAVAVGGLTSALLPCLLETFGNRYRPGIL